MSIALKSSSSVQSKSALAVTTSLAGFAVAVGDLVHVTFADRIGTTAPTISDSLGHIWTANAGPTTMTVRKSSWRTKVTTAGTMVVTVAHASTGAGGAARVIVRASFTGVAQAPLEEAVANSPQSVNPYDSVASGTQAQLENLVVTDLALSNDETGTVVNAPDTLILAQFTTGGTDAYAALAFRVVASTAAVASQWTTAPLEPDGVVGLTIYKGEGGELPLSAVSAVSQVASLTTDDDVPLSASATLNIEFLTEQVFDASVDVSAATDIVFNGGLVQDGAVDLSAVTGFVVIGENITEGSVPLDAVTGFEPTSFGSVVAGAVLESATAILAITGFTGEVEVQLVVDSGFVPAAQHDAFAELDLSAAATILEGSTGDVQSELLLSAVTGFAPVAQGIFDDDLTLAADTAFVTQGGFNFDEDVLFAVAVAQEQIAAVIFNSAVGVVILSVQANMITDRGFQNVRRRAIVVGP